MIRYVPPCRAGACPRRHAALLTTTDVGAGIPDGPGRNAVRARQGCRALRWGVPKGRRPPPRDGVGTAALRLRRGDCAICGWRFGTMGDFAPCAARVFRPLRRAGISLAAASDRGRCLWTPRLGQLTAGWHTGGKLPYKKSSKTFIFGPAPWGAYISSIRSYHDKDGNTRRPVPTARHGRPVR